jgi:hypothetical protein
LRKHICWRQILKQKSGAFSSVTSQACEKILLRRRRATASGCAIGVRNEKPLSATKKSSHGTIVVDDEKDFPTVHYYTCIYHIRQPRGDPLPLAHTRDNLAEPPRRPPAAIARFSDKGWVKTYIDEKYRYKKPKITGDFKKLDFKHVNTYIVDYIEKNRTLGTLTITCFGISEKHLENGPPTSFASPLVGFEPNSRNTSCFTESSSEP